ncbi:MAG: UDP-N-acetylmuramoyl-tripeptide--D-alanyl-D-alanine ligase [Clostridia bacterium]|nr:UDP-N-acetylmuramoyl-tripeptide--D-alanyl-D-alanine ligase [Clostridia bacterium]
MWVLILKVVLMAVCAMQAAFETVYYVHMLQLNSYRGERYLNWMRGADDRSLPPRRLIAALPLAIIMMFGFENANDGVNVLEIGAYAGAVLLCLISAIADRPRKAKKPLVYTPRVKRLLVTIGLMEAALLALAFPFSNRVTGAMLLVLVLLPVMLVYAANIVNSPIEKKIAKGFTDDAKRILASMPDLKIIGITGSYGKTSAKNFLTTLLSAKYNVLMTPESYNTPMGVVRTVRERLRASHEIFICEMGAKNKGDIKEICDIVHPHHGMITAIGEQHLETFKTIDTIIDTKFELADALPEGGKVFLNVDNEYIAARETANNVRISYGLKDGANYTATDIKTDENGTTFTVTAPDRETCTYTTRLLGAHTIQNLVGCVAVAHQLGMELAEMKQPIRQMKPVEHRLQLLPNGYIDDAYNSNPAGFRSALDVLGAMENTRRVLVTPGMVELGTRQEALNEELGAYAADRCDWAVLVGEKQAPPLKKGLLSAGFDEERIFVAMDLHQGLSFVHSLPPVERQIVLLENDLPDNF